MDVHPLSDQDHELVDHAQRVIDAHTDGPDGVHTVAAAVRDTRGNIYAGINLYHFTGGPCAELVALGHARASGARDLATIVAVGNEGRGPVAPCGRDRQVLSDYHPSIRVILPTSSGLGSVAIDELLPEPMHWTPDPEDHDPT